jgi:acyl-[acyl-carrier-protein] desaturase
MIHEHDKNFNLNSRLEVMNSLEKSVESVIATYLNVIESNWQASDLLPVASNESFISDFKIIQEQAKSLSKDFLVVLVGDTITEEALPTYQTWLAGVAGVNQHQNNNWMKWVRHWTAEENRHGDVLNRYLYLSGRICMKEFEASTQYLIATGFDNQAKNDPYKNFVYTSFQEAATNVSHRRVATLAKKEGNVVLSRLCGLVASDEARHAKAYKAFVNLIFEVDANEMMVAFESMMRSKILMPAVTLRQLGSDENIFSGFSLAAQRIGVYTSHDYVDILSSLLNDWRIDKITGLQEDGEKARDYLMLLPSRLLKIIERIKTPNSELNFKWILN